MLTDSYLKAAAAHDREVEDRAPYNQPDGSIDDVRCEMCGSVLSEAEKAACAGWSERHCDTCTVRQAQWFGIWDEADKAALARLNAKA